MKFPKLLGLVSHFVAPAPALKPGRVEVNVPEKDAADMVLDRAAEIIEERGWSRGAFVGPHGNVCTLQAIRIAAREASFLWIGAGRLEAQAASRFKKEVTGGEPIPSWNDTLPYNGRSIVLYNLRRTSL